MNTEVKTAAEKPCPAHLKWEADTAAWRESEKVAAEEMARIDEIAAQLLKGSKHGN